RARPWGTLPPWQRIRSGLSSACWGGCRDVSLPCRCRPGAQVVTTGPVACRGCGQQRRRVLVPWEVSRPELARQLLCACRRKSRWKVLGSTWTGVWNGVVTLVQRAGLERAASVSCRTCRREPIAAARRTSSRTVHRRWSGSLDSHEAQHEHADSDRRAAAGSFVLGKQSGRPPYHIVRGSDTHCGVRHPRAARCTEGPRLLLQVPVAV